MASQTRSGAQNQHYVPKFILRNFLSDEAKEQVSVFSKRSGKGFVTSIRNVMAERRFHEFAIGDEFIASFEQGICRIEDMVLPVYRKVLQSRRLDDTAEEKAGLAVFIAFQMIRTRQQRQQFVDMEAQLKEHLTKHGGDIEDIDGYTPLTDERLTHEHIEFIKHSIGEFAQIIAQKDFVLLEAAQGRSFYLGDNPVCLHNNEPRDPIFGNVGLAVKGVEIYLPLSADLMLAAWCPSLVERIRQERGRQNLQHKSELLQRVLRGQISVEQMRTQRMVAEKMQEPVDVMLDCFATGRPSLMPDTSMDYCNSPQMNFAREFVICKQGDFELAKRFIG
jgi:hypothetical protein